MWSSGLFCTKVSLALRSHPCACFSGTISVSDEETLLELAKSGIYLELDLFGIEVSLYQANEPFAMPSDSQRIQMIKFLFDNGHDKVVIAHDVHTKHRLVS